MLPVWASSFALPLVVSAAGSWLSHRYARGERTTEWSNADVRAAQDALRDLHLGYLRRRDGRPDPDDHDLARLEANLEVAADRTLDSRVIERVAAYVAGAPGEVEPIRYRAAMAALRDALRRAR